MFRTTLITLLWAGAAAQADEITPEAMVERAVHVCGACHGDTARNKSDSIPNIAGQMPLYIQAQLKDFRTQTRAETDVQAYMWGVSALLDDATINGLAQYFAAQSPAPGVTGDPKRIAEGQTIIDFVRVSDSRTIAGIYEGICW